jgi:deazaflavin-dependent oxidoreductase (nitroreductase family)
MRGANVVAAWLARHGSGRALGTDLLVLTTVGRRTGERRRVPVVGVDGGDGTWLVVGSANGDARHPAWYLNLAADPHAVVEVGRRVVDVVATELEGNERAEAWRRIVAAAPQFGAYGARTDRRIPVVRLTPVA